VNGQQEVFYLRQEDVYDETDRFSDVVKEADSQKYEIDADSFKREVPSLGSYLDHISVIGTATIAANIGKEKITLDLISWIILRKE